MNRVPFRPKPTAELNIWNKTNPLNRDCDGPLVNPQKVTAKVSKAEGWCSWRKKKTSGNSPSKFVNKRGYKILQDQPMDNTVRGVQQSLAPAWLPSTQRANKLYACLLGQLTPWVLKTLRWPTAISRGLVLHVNIRAHELWFSMGVSSVPVTLNVPFATHISCSKLWYCWLVPLSPSLKYFSCVPVYPRRKHS